jgi:hypothetical protein
MARGSSSTKHRELTRLATLERRNGTEQLRVSCDEVTPANGERSRYASIRVWYFASDGWRPGKSGTTIRANELAAVIEALQQALSAIGEDEAA